MCVVVDLFSICSLLSSLSESWFWCGSPLVPCLKICLPWGCFWCAPHWFSFLKSQIEFRFGLIPHWFLALKLASLWNKSWYTTSHSLLGFNLAPRLVLWWLNTGYVFQDLLALGLALGCFPNCFLCSSLPHGGAWCVSQLVSCLKILFTLKQNLVCLILFFLSSRLHQGWFLCDTLL